MANDKEAKNKKETKNKKRFFKDFKAELKRVVWPTPKQLLNSTVAVITIVLVIGVIVFALDMGFELLNRQNAKLQSSLQEKYSNKIPIQCLFVIFFINLKSHIIEAHVFACHQTACRTNMRI